jgi:SAM-dependent methyltransferase
MNAEESYVKISSFFNIWSKLIESPTRNIQVLDSNIKDSKILIISPPTDRGLKILSEANANGESYLLCFSASLERFAKHYMQKQGILNLKTCTSPFFEIPFGDGYFDLIFANCFFDFCSESDFDKIIEEIKRVLNNQSLFFSIYMNFPSRLGENIWFGFFKIFPWLSQGCHPVDIKPGLKRGNFSLKKDVSMRRFGFPMKYIIAER